MKKLLLALCLCASVVFDSAAQNITTVTTLVIPAQVTNAAGVWIFNAATNSVVIPNGEAARVASIRWADEGVAWFVKDGIDFPAMKGDVIAGPVVFYLRNNTGETSLLTLERWRVKKTK